MSAGVIGLWVNDRQKSDVDAVMPFAGLRARRGARRRCLPRFRRRWAPVRAQQLREPCVPDGPPGGALVLKFYRPGRWSDAQIAEEHAFTAELAAAEMAVAAPLNVAGRTLFRYQKFRFAVFPLAAGTVARARCAGGSRAAGSRARPPASDRRRPAVSRAPETLGRQTRVRRTRASAVERAVSGEHRGVVPARDRCAARARDASVR